MILFIRIPKNASTSLYESFGLKNIIHSREEVLQKKLSALSWWQRFAHPSHVNLEMAINFLGMEVLNYLKVCCVRNPFARLVSAFEFAKKFEVWRVYSDKEPAFDEFVEYYCNRVNDKTFVHGNSQTRWISYQKQIRMDYIIRFENLAEDLNKFNSDYGYDFKLDHLNKTEHKDYSFYYSKKLKQLVYDAYKVDFDNFNYEFN